MKILVTGSNGFIAKNLIFHLRELKEFQVISFDRHHSLEDLIDFVSQSDAIIHLAGVNRPDEIKEFSEINVGLTSQVCEAIASQNRHIPIIISSSTQAVLDNPYGQSKLQCEKLGEKLFLETGNPVCIFRLPGVFGKWSKPNYNSVVATFCNNVANHLPIQVNNPNTLIDLVYVDDVIKNFISLLCNMPNGLTSHEVEPVYRTSLGRLAAQIESFRNCRNSLVSEEVGGGLVRALYATYISFLSPSEFIYDLVQHGDERGIFVEMLKTKNSGQFSFFTAHTGVTRGGHYHHTKTEKFLVIKGRARFSFRNVLTNERYEVITSEDKSQIVETIPGWAHDITNIGESELVVMLWANEIYDHHRPDTIISKV